MSSDLDIEKCFEFAKELTLQAGKILKCSLKDEQVIHNKGEWDFVTNYDYKIEKILIDGLSKEFPDHKIIAEETVVMKEMPELTDAPTWMLDPIDGTINFMHLYPHFCISIALTVCKELVLGIVYNPSNSELYTAIKGKGAFLNGEPIHTSNITELKKAMYETDTTVIKFIKKDKDIYVARKDALTEITQVTRSVGSAALTLVYIARGAMDCFQVAGLLKVWDVAAGILILREAGGIVIETKGGVCDIMKPNIIAASTETLAREISKLIIDTDLKTQRKRLKRT